MAEKVQIRSALMNKYSISLSKEENEMIFELIGEQCQTLCTAFLSITITIELVAVDVYTGYLCLIKNNAEDNKYFLRLYSLEQKRLLWQLTILGHMKFLKTTATLISYNDRMERTLTELNFSSKSDAQEFFESINTVLMVLQVEGQKRRRSLRRSGSIRLLFQNVLGIRRDSELHTKSATNSALTPTKEAKTADVSSCKHEIGQPFNFKHIVRGTDAVIMHKTSNTLETECEKPVIDSQTKPESSHFKHEIDNPFHFQPTIPAIENKEISDVEKSRPTSLTKKHNKNVSLSTPDLLNYNCKDFGIQLSF